MSDLQDIRRSKSKYLFISKGVFYPSHFLCILNNLEFDSRQVLEISSYLKGQDQHCSPPSPQLNMCCRFTSSHGWKGPVATSKTNLPL